MSNIGKTHRHCRAGGFNLLWEAGAKGCSRGSLSLYLVTWGWLLRLTKISPLIAPHGSHHPESGSVFAVVSVSYLFVLASLIFEDEVREEWNVYPKNK